MRNRIALLKVVMVDNINPGLQPVDIRDGLQQCLYMPAGTLNQGIVDIKKTRRSIVKLKNPRGRKHGAERGNPCNAFDFGVEVHYLWSIVEHNGWRRSSQSHTVFFHVNKKTVYLADARIKKSQNGQ